MSGEVGGAGGAYSYEALKRLDQIWSNICSAQEGSSCHSMILVSIKEIRLSYVGKEFSIPCVC